ncbi:hypothetical protein NCCP2716_17590 [Sporosarcina sp. NCCP-2716]|uniref:S8 family peptidase n=1 Tax=Sporosarcina sp. NCCP-2716 TaxID=2943679 RepID=UPI00203B04D8|nr:S8 family serine peptidase [Sporosarcina sp. NCCP-2716]GKV69261.1 hypothetical protein NCCP2716_17590 [Sporosarcina sp. NCCP-2716]
MGKSRLLLSSLLSVLLLSSGRATLLPSAAAAAGEPGTRTVTAPDLQTDETPSELLVHYTELPRSVATVPSLPSETGNAESIAPSVQLLTFDTLQACEKAAEKLENNPLVETVEPNYTRTADAVPNDPYYTDQWWLSHVKAPSLWPLAAKQTKPIVVAVIDSGIDSSILDFAGRIAPGGYNFTDSSQDVRDTNGHGTSVSGVIAATLNNGYGIAGVTGPFDVRILPLKTIRQDGTGTVAMNVQAIDYAIRQHADVINISQGGVSASSFEQQAIQRAADAGILIVASAGNDADKGNPVIYPAAYSQVLSVASVNRYNEHSAFSTYNEEVDLSAPGEKIVTNWPGGKFMSMSGTSFSAPIAAGAAAMIQAELPGLPPQETKTLLMETAKDLGAPGRDPIYGAGVLDMEKLSAALAVRLEKAKTVPVTGIQLDQQMMNLTIGNPATASGGQLTARVLPDNAANRAVTWNSSDPLVAKVDQTGAVTAVSKGQAVITAKTADGGFTASVSVTVTAIAPFTGDFPDMEIDDAKIFAIKFNTALKPDFDYTGYVQVAAQPDSTASIAGTAVQADPSDPRMLYVAKPSHWAKGTYYLTIKKGLPAQSGKRLNRDTRLKFTVR